MELLYTVSYLWYPSIGLATVVVVGLIVSFITGMYTDKDNDKDKVNFINSKEKLQCGLKITARK